MARLTEVLTREHQELLEQLETCAPGGLVHLKRFEAFRKRELRHIAVEERVLLPALLHVVDLAPAVRNAMRRDHESLVVLCVTRPNTDFVRDLKEFLTWHQGVEEARGGLFSLYDRHVRDETKVNAELKALRPLALPPLASGAGVAAAVQDVRRQVLL